MGRLFQAGVIVFVCVSVLGCVRTRALRLALPESPVSYDQAWASSLEASLLYYDRIVIEDKKTGFFQTSWQTHQVGVLIGTPVKRSRLIGRVASQKPFRLNLDMEQEAFSMELGRWVSDPPDQKRLFEIKDRLRARLRF
ncbi:MAG: hypothetical protein ACE5F7_03155 [Nitrospiria bacterium]